MKIHIHGNCQSFVIAKLLQEVFSDWEISYFEVHANQIVERNAEYRDAIKTADIILTQVVRPGFRGRDELTTDWVKAEAKLGCEIIVIPGMHFEGHHLGYGHLSGLGDLCYDALAAHLIASGLPPETAVELLLSTDLLASSFVRSEAEASLNEMMRREREDEIDIPLSPIAVAFSGPVQLFHVVNHPYRQLYVYLINSVLERLSIKDRRLKFEGRDYQRVPHIPMLPTVAHAHQGRQDSATNWNVEQELRVLVGSYEPMSQRTYFEKMVVQLADHPLEKIQAAIDTSWRTTAFLKRLTQANPNLLDSVRRISQ